MKTLRLSLLCLLMTGSAFGQWSTGPYKYDAAGNITKIGDDVYTYDDAGRLESATVRVMKNQPPSVTQAYTYDEFGNRLTSTTTGATYPCRGASVAITCDEASTADPATNRLTNATYDAAGNVVTMGSRTFQYDAAGMVKRSEGDGAAKQYVYTADDERIGIYIEGHWRWTIRDSGNAVLSEYTSQDDAVLGRDNWVRTKDYLYRGSQLLATNTPTNGRTHFLLDHLGTPRVIVNAQGQKIGEHNYLPFGAELQLPATAALESPEDTHKFTGHERDASSSGLGLDYMHARYYGAGVGRFLAVDPTWASADLGEPQSWNRYAYVQNSPVSFDDPDGRLRRDAYGRLIFEQRTVTIAYHSSRPSGFQVVAGFLFADDGRRILAIQNVDYDVAMNTNCHGLTFGDGQFAIHDNQVASILEGDGYAATTAPAVGDVAVYRNADGQVVHSATVTEVDENGGVSQVAGLGGTQMQSQSTPAKPGTGGGWHDPNATVEYHRKTTNALSDAARACQIEDITTYEKEPW